MNHLRRQLLHTGIWALLAIALVAVIRFSNAPKRELGTEVDRLLPKLAQGEPRYLGLNRGGTEITFVRAQSGGEWVAQDPSKMPPYSDAINEVVSALREIRVLRPVPVSPRDGTSNSLAEMGVEPSALVWRVALGDEEWTLRFGRQAPDAQRGTYVAVTAAPHAKLAVYVVDAHMSSLDVQPERLLDTRVLRLTVAAVQALAIESPRSRVHLRRAQHSEHWVSADSPHIRVQPDWVSALFARMGSLRAEPRNHGTRAMDTASASAAIKLFAQTGEVRIEAFNQCTDDQESRWIRVVDSGVRAFCTKAPQLDDVLPDEVRALYDTRLFTLRVDEVESVSARLGKDRTELNREGMGFSVVPPVSDGLALQAGNDYLSTLLSTRGKIVQSRFPEPTALPEPEYIEIRSSTVTQQGDTAVERLLLGPTINDGNRLVKRTDDDAVLEVDRATADLLQLGARIRAIQSGERIRHVPMPQAGDLN